MAIEFSCKCGKRLRVKDELVGRKFKCPACGDVALAEPPAPAESNWIMAELDADLKRQASPDPHVSLKFAAENSSPSPSLTKSNGPSPGLKLFWLLSSPFSFTAMGALLASEIKPGTRAEKVSRSTLQVVAPMFGILLLVLSPVGFFAAYKVYLLSSDSASWPTTDGTITKSTIDVLQLGLRSNHRAAIEYIFSVGGTRYSGSRIRFADSTPTNAGAAQAVAERYPVNLKTKVYYCPSNPSQCTLEVGPSGGSIAIFIGPILVTAAGLFFVLLGRGDRRPA